MTKIKIYTTSTCPYCEKAKNHLRNLNLDFEEIILKSNEEFEDLIKQTSHMTVPQIFIGDNFIGGCDDLEKLIETKQINSYLEK